MEASNDAAAAQARQAEHISVLEAKIAALHVRHCSLEGTLGLVM